MMKSTAEDVPDAFSDSTFFEELEGLSFAERWKKLIALGQGSVRATEPSCDGRDLTTQPCSAQLRQTLCSFANSDVHYERMLAAMFFNGAVAETMKQKHPLPSDLLEIGTQLVQNLSPKIYTLVCMPMAQIESDENLKQLLLQIAFPQYKALCKALAKCGKSHILHELYAEHWQDIEQSSCEAKAIGCNLSSARKQQILSAFLSAEELRQMPAESQWALSSRALQHLSFLHPELMVERLLEQVESCLSRARENAVSTNSSDEEHSNEDEDSEASLPPPLVRNIDVTARRLCTQATKKHFHLGMKLIQAALPFIPDRSQVHNLAKLYLHQSTTEMCAYILAHASLFRTFKISASSRRLLKRLEKDPDLIVALGKAQILALHTCFDCFSPSVRQWIIQQYPQEVYSLHQKECIPTSVLKKMPDRAQREDAAIKMFHHPSLQDQPKTRIAYLSVLPFPKACELGEPFITDPAGDIRATSAEALIHGANYYPAHLNDILNFCLKRKKEQDPWRSCMFLALSALPVHIWKAEHFPAIEELILAAFDAKDASRGTFGHVKKLLVRVAETHVDFAAKQLCLFMRRECSLNASLVALTPGATRKLLTALFPLLQRLVAEEQIESFRITLKQLTKLQRVQLRDLLAPLYVLCMQSATADVYMVGLEFYYEAFAQEAVQQAIPALLREEKDAIFIPLVQETLEKFIHGELLNPYLTLVELWEGRFSKKMMGDKVQRIDFNTQWAYRWTARQQRTYAKTLAPFLLPESPNALVPDLEVLERVVKLPSSTLDDALRPYVQCNFENKSFRDAAVLHLGHMNDGESLRELESAMRDDRVREAVVAMCRRLRYSTDVNALNVVMPVLLTCKLVTVQKELVRFIGGLACGEASECLRLFASEKGSDLHRDVKIAMQCALWNFLYQRQTWAIYDQAVGSSRVAECVKVLQIPDNALQLQWQVDRMKQLILVLLHHSSAEVRNSTIYRLRQNKRLRSPEICEALFEFVDNVKNSTAHEALFCTLECPEVHPKYIAARVANLKDDRSLNQVIGAMCNQYERFACTASGSRRMSQLLKELSALLIAKERQPVCICKAVMCGSAHLWERQLQQLIDKKLLHSGAAAWVVELHYCSRLSPETCQAMEATFRRHAQPFFRRLGLALLEHIAGQSEWSAEKVAALALYRGDPDIWVRSCALLAGPQPPDEAQGGDDNGNSATQEE